MPSKAMSGLCRPAPRALSSRFAALICAQALQTPRSKPDLLQSPLHRHVTTTPDSVPHIQQQDAEASLPSSYINQPNARSSWRPIMPRRESLPQWRDLIQAQLPDKLRDPAVRAKAPVDISAILAGMREAQRSNTLVDLGFKKIIDWNIIEWLLREALNQADTSRTMDSIEDLVLSIPAANSQSIDQSVEEKTITKTKSELLEQFLPVTRDKYKSLDLLTLTSRGRRQSRRHNVGKDVWHGVGSIVRRCISTPDNAAPMRVALNIIKYLHQNGFVPEKLMEPNYASDLPIAQKPIQEYLRQNGRYHIEEEEAKAHSPQSCAAWFEFVLWSCLFNGQWPEAAALLVPSGNGFGERGLLFSSAKLWHMTEEGSLPDQVKASETPQTTTEAHVSEQVITAIVDALLCHVFQSRDMSKKNKRNITANINRLKQIRRLLVLSNQSLANMTWDSVVARLLELSLPGDELRTSQITSILRMAHLHDKNDSTAGTIDEASFASAGYIFDDSAVVTGLYHQILEAQIKVKDVQGATRVLEDLLESIEINREKAAAEWRHYLDSTRHGGSPLSQNNGAIDEVHSRAFIEENVPSAIPSIPPTILAGLLDLVTDTGMEYVGSRMINSGDMGGPLIGPQLYTNDKVAPALLRHAAVTNNNELLSTVTKAQGSTIAGKTLVALSYSYALRANWKGFRRVISFCEQYAVHQWKAEDISQVIKALLSQMHNATKPASAAEAATMLEGLLSGELLGKSSPSQDDLQDVAAILSSINGTLAALCHNVVHSSSHRQNKLPIECFNTLLDGICHAYGALKAQDVYVDWCTVDVSRRESTTRQRAIASHAGDIRPAEIFGELDSNSMALRDAMSEDGMPSVKPTSSTFTPNLATIRIIVAQALKETHAQSDDYVAMTVDQGLPRAQASLTEAESLEWASRELRGRFGMNTARVNHELQGYLSSKLNKKTQGESISTAYYRNRTLMAWTAVCETHFSWASDIENKMRSFAVDKNRQEIRFDSVHVKQKIFLQSLADDFGLTCEKDEGQGIMVRKIPVEQDYSVLVPQSSVAHEAARRYAF